MHPWMQKEMVSQLEQIPVQFGRASTAPLGLSYADTSRWQTESIEAEIGTLPGFTHMKSSQQA